MKCKAQKRVSSMGREYHLQDSTSPSRTSYLSPALISPVVLSPSQPIHSQQQQGHLRQRKRQMRAIQPRLHSPAIPQTLKQFNRPAATTVPVPPLDTTGRSSWNSWNVFRQPSPIKEEDEGRMIALEEREDMHLLPDAETVVYTGNENQQPRREQEEEGTEETEGKGWYFWFCIGFDRSGPPP